MSDNYSIDDILAEVDKKRDGHKSEPTESVTEIIGGSDLEMIRSAASRTRTTDPEEQERAEQEAARERAENIRKAAEKRSRMNAETSEEAEAREREESIRKVAEHRKSVQQQKKELEERRRRDREEKQRLAEESRLEKLRAEAEKRQEPEEERTMQFTPPVEEPAREPQHSGFTAELSSPSEAAKLFADEEPEVVQPRSEHVQPFVKPAVSGADDDIIFHTKSDLVTTETQKMRKLQRIEEINRALLAADRAAEEPDDLVDSLNPMESREKAVDELKNVSAPQQEIGDTLAVSGNDLKKMSSGEAEHVKEYSPVTSRRKSHSSADEVLFTPGAQKKTDVSEKERRSSDALVASLNQKLKEQREKNIAEERTVTLSDISNPRSLPPKGLNFDYDKVIDTSILPKTDPVAAVQEAEALAARKKRRISNFMLEDIDDEEEPDDDEYDDEDEEEEEEVIDLDDENVITERLARASKGLAGRLVILGLLTIAAIIAEVFFQFKITGIPILSELAKPDPDIFLYTDLTIGILSFGACSSVITNGFSRLMKGKPDGDTLCAFAHIGALGSIVMYLANANYLMMKQSYVYLIVSMLALCFNTVSKLCTVRAAKNNFRFVSGDSDKYFVECTDGDDAEQLARGAVRGFPVVASMRKTEMLCDFIISTYCEDVSDRISRILTPVVLGLSVVGGAIGFFCSGASNTGNIMNQWSFAATVFSAVLCVGATFTGALIVMLPMLSASRKTNERRAAILGYSAVEDFSAVNSVLVEAKTLFPAGSVSIRNIWDYNKNGTNGAQHVTIDEAIIYAASLAIATDSILADPLFNMLNYKQALLKKVSNCVYESGMGVSGWIGSRRVLLGSRDHMKSHGIVVPDSKKESALNKNHDEVIYLAVAGEVCMLFFVSLSANPQVKKHVQRLARNDVSIIIKTVDGALSEGAVSELFDIYTENVKILPAESHDLFDEHTKYSGKGSAAVSCDGTFSSLASAINGAKAIRERIRVGCIMEIAGICLGILLAFIFGAFTNYSLLNGFWIAGYNLAWLILTAVVMQFRRI